MESKELGKFAAVLSIFVDTEFDVLAERLVELVEIVLILGDLAEEIHALLYDVLTDDFEDLVLLQGFTGDIEGKILRVDDTTDEVEVFGNDVLAIIHNEYTTNIEFDVVALLLCLKEIEWCT